MWRRILIATMAISFIVPIWANAQDLGFSQGDREVTVSGTGTSDDSLDNTVLSFGLSYGYFFTDHLEGVIRQDFAYADVGGDDDNWAGSTRLAADYHFDFNRVQPYVGLSFGYLYGDEAIDESFVAGPEAGLKVFVVDNAFIFASAEYEFLFEDADEADDRFDDGRFVYAVGVGFRW